MDAGRRAAAAAAVSEVSRLVTVELLELTDTHGKLVIEGVHPYFVNALRRTLLAEVPKLAVEDVTFYDNTSALFDETIAHRIGLLPIPTDPSTLTLVGQTDDEGNPSYIVRYTLTKEGPCTVYSGDMECEDPKFALTDKKIPIVELLAGQRLILEATAILGIGTTHAKWQVCSGVGYKYYPTANVDNRKISKEEAHAVVAKTPKGILGLDGDKLVVLDEQNVNLADASGAIGDGFSVSYDDRKFVFRFETDGSLSAADAMHKAVEILKERFTEFRELTKDLS